MAKFTEQIGEISPTPFIAPGVVDTSKATLIKAAGAGIQDAWEGYADAKLEGGEADPEEVKGMFPEEGPPDIEGINLRQIAEARKQGLIKSDQANVLVQTAVKRASNLQPGRAHEFRQQAAQFFGQFGPGMGALSPTSEEAAAAKAAERAQKDIDDYVINVLKVSPFKWYNRTPEVMKEVSYLDRQETIKQRALQRAALVETDMKLALPEYRTALYAEGSTSTQTLESNVLNKIGMDRWDQVRNLPKGDRENVKRLVQQEADNILKQMNKNYLDKNIEIKEVNQAFLPVQKRADAIVAFLEGNSTLQNLEEENKRIIALNENKLLSTKNGRAAMLQARLIRGVQLPLNSQAKLEKVYNGAFDEVLHISGLLDPTAPSSVDTSMKEDGLGNLLKQAQEATHVVWEGVKSKVLGKEPVTEEQSNDIKDYLKVLTNLTDSVDVQPIQNLSTVMKIAEDPAFVKVLKANPELAVQLKENYLVAATDSIQRTINYVNTQWSQSYGQGDVSSLIRLKLDPKNGRIAFVPLDNLTASRMPSANRISKEFTDKYANKINQSIKTLSHIDQSIDYTETMRRLFQDGSFSMFLPTVLTKEAQDELPADFFAEAGGVADIIQEPTNIEPTAEEEPTPVEEQSPMDKAFVNKYIAEVGDTDEDLNDLLEDQRLKDDPKLRLRVIRWFQELAGE